MVELSCNRLIAKKPEAQTRRCAQFQKSPMETVCGARGGRKTFVTHAWTATCVHMSLRGVCVCGVCRYTIHTVVSFFRP